MTGKNPNTKTIEVSTATYDRIHSVKADLAKIMGKKKVSFDTAFKLFFVAEPLDVILSNLILEDKRSAE